MRFNWKAYEPGLFEEDLKKAKQIDLIENLIFVQ